MSPIVALLAAGDRSKPYHINIHSPSAGILFTMPERGKEPERPSFTGYWKSSDSQDPSKQLTFVQYDDPRSSAKKGKKHKDKRETEAQEEESSNARTESRRAQVRKAQIQHRQRKANYIQQLESDITTLNKDIEEAESETQRLARENVAMRQSIYSSPHPSTLSYGTASYPSTHHQTADPSTLDQWSAQGYDTSADPLSYIADGSTSVHDYSQWSVGGNGEEDENGYYLDDDAGSAGYGYYYDHSSYYAGQSGSPAGRGA